MAKASPSWIFGISWVADNSMAFHATRRKKAEIRMAGLFMIMDSTRGGSYSVNAAHSCTSVKYLTARVVQLLDVVKWYIKADLSAGYRQFGTHPVDWRFQVYCNGPDEH